MNPQDVAERIPIYCRCCFYILNGLPSGRCPECGEAFNPEDSQTFCTGSPDIGWGRYEGLIASILMISGSFTVLAVGVVVATQRWFTWGPVLGILHGVVCFAVGVAMGTRRL